MTTSTVRDIEYTPEIAEDALCLVRRYATKRTLKRWAVSDIYSEQVKPYTYAHIILRHKDNGKTVKGTGFSKQRPTDTWNTDIGFRVALSRAIKDALGVKEGVKHG